jgi:hypothetical protein
MQSFSGPSPAGPVTTIYCLSFETPPTWRARSPYLYRLEEGWPDYTPRYCFPFLSPTTTHRATVEVLDSAFTRDSWSPYNFGVDPVENTVSNSSVLWRHVFIFIGCSLGKSRLFWLHYSCLSVVMSPYFIRHFVYAIY